VHDNLKGQIPIGLCILKTGVSGSDESVKKELAQMMRDTIGPIACYKETAVVKRLPKTRSGKILRGTMRKIANGEPYTIPSIIDDPSVLGEIEEVLRKIGYAKKQ
jgi:propionyl-CoA synthetase